MKPLTLDMLVGCGADRASAAKYLDWLNTLLPDPRFQINSLLRVAHFLGQVLVESDRMKATHEYASGKEYEGNVGLGNIHPSDGVKFKGRGGIELTGYKNYLAFSRKYGVDCVNHPELLEKPENWVLCATDYWLTRNLNAWADKDKVWQISCLINIGHIPGPKEKRQFPNNWSDRQAYVAKCKIALKPLFD